jgi:hypothetical protein
MSQRLWLIVEDENDGVVVRHLLAKKGFALSIEVITATGGSGGISRLAAQLSQLIKTIQANKRFDRQGDCIAVLHDHDEQTQQQNRKLYEDIEKVCAAQGIKRAVAIDELEAWMLADSGLCTWLEITPRNCDAIQKPSDQLRSHLSKKNLKYQGKTRADVVSKLVGDGDRHSPSMREALKLFDDAPCLKKDA